MERHGLGLAPALLSCNRPTPSKSNCRATPGSVPRFQQHGCHICGVLEAADPLCASIQRRRGSFSQAANSGSTRLCCLSCTGRHWVLDALNRCIETMHHTARSQQAGHVRFNSTVVTSFEVLPEGSTAAAGILASHTRGSSQFDGGLALPEAQFGCSSRPKLMEVATEKASLSRVLACAQVAGGMHCGAHRLHGL